MFSTPSTLTLGSIQAANEKSGGIVLQYFKIFVSIFSHISEKKGYLYIFLNKSLMLQIYLSAMQDVGVYTAEHILVAS